MRIVWCHERPARSKDAIGPNDDIRLQSLSGFQYNRTTIGTDLGYTASEADIRAEFCCYIE